MITDALLKRASEAAALAMGKTGPEDWRTYAPQVRVTLAVMEVAFSHMSQDETAPETAGAMADEPDYSEVEARPTFQRELQSLINRYSAENGSNTPDFMLAEYLTDQLAIWDRTVNAREKWYGRENAGPGQPIKDSEVQRAVPRH